MTGPWVVVSVSGNKAALEDRSDPTAKVPRRIEGHMEQMILVPPDAEDFESRAPEIEFEDVDSGRRSIGQIVQASDAEKTRHVYS